MGQGMLAQCCWRACAIRPAHAHVSAPAAVTRLRSPATRTNVAAMLWPGLPAVVRPSRALQQQQPALYSCRLTAPMATPCTAATAASEEPAQICHPVAAWLVTAP